MEKVEKKLTRFRANLKNKRKLSLPMFINHFNQQWSERDPQQQPKTGCRTLSSEKLPESVETVDLSSGKTGRQNRRNSAKESLLGSNLVSPNQVPEFGGSLVSMVFEPGDKNTKLSHSNSSSSGTSSSGSRQRSNSNASTSSDSSSYNSMNSLSKRQYSTLPHSCSSTGLYLKLTSSNRSSSTLPLSSNSTSKTHSVPRRSLPSDQISSLASFNPENQIEIGDVTTAPETDQAPPIFGNCSKAPPISGNCSKAPPPFLNGTSVYRNPILSNEDRQWSHPHLVGTVSSPGGSTFTSFIVPNGKYNFDQV